MLSTCVLGLTIPAQISVASVGVTVLPAVASSLGETTRDGAGEFALLIEAARLKRVHSATGLVAIADRHGMLRSGGERGARQLALSGVAMVKILPAGPAVGDDTDLFLCVHAVTAEEAVAVLQRCLERYGPPPAARDVTQPTAGELAAIRRHVRPFQVALDALAGSRLVAR